MKYIPLITFIIFTSIHLYASNKKDKRLRAITKPFLVSSLLVFYLLSTDNVSLTVVLALIFSWIGDVLLIGPGVKWFTVGGISFIFSHFFFVLSYYPDIIFSKINIIFIVVLALAFLITATYIFTKFKPYLKKSLFYPMYIYLLINATMNCFAIFRCISITNYKTVITCIGALLFFISDTILFFVRFNPNSRFKTHFWAMLTYSLCELLIVVGLL